MAVEAEQSQGRRIRRIWLDPAVRIHPAAAEAIRGFAAVIVGPGSFYTSLMPVLLVQGVAEAVRSVTGPILLVAKILTEGRGMRRFTAGDAVREVSGAIGWPVDVLLVIRDHPSGDVLERYAAEHKEPLLLGKVPPGCDVVAGQFWQGPIARHARHRLSYAVWSVLAARLLAD